MRMLQLGIASLIVTLCLAHPMEALARTQPIYNVIDKPISTLSGQPLTLAEVESILVDAISTKGWSIAKVEDGLLKAQINVRKHFAAIDVTYNADRYSITYRDSEVLLYDGTKIHRNYNKWIKLIERLVEEKAASY